LGAFNPYRYFFPAVMSGQLGGVGWIYLVGPILALALAIIGAWLLNALRSQFGIDFDDIAPVKAIQSRVPKLMKSSSYSVDNESTTELRSVSVNTTKVGGKQKGDKRQ
jgi:hypothetical protein